MSSAFFSFLWRCKDIVRMSGFSVLGC